jgi:predicted DNA-binding antitoxin AbrB/MazE fold protein
MTVLAKYENGVFRPLRDVSVNEGTIVEIQLPAPPSKPEPSRLRLRDFEFCGMWRDRDEMTDSVNYVNHLREGLRG